MLRLANANETGSSTSGLSATARAETSPCAYGLAMDCCSLLALFYLLLTCPCSSLCSWICHSPSWCREGKWSRGFLKTVPGELQPVLGGIRKRILFSGSYHAGSWFLFVSCNLFVVLLLLFPGVFLWSLFSLPCWVRSTSPVCSVLGRLDTPWMFWGRSEFWVNIQSPGAIVLILKSRFAAKSSAF